MPLHSLRRSARVRPSVRVVQAAGRFDLPVPERVEFAVAQELPSRDEDWTIGALVGPSGCGKSSLLAAAYGAPAPEEWPWPAHAPLLDGFPPGPLDPILAALLATGLASPRTWLKPYRALSTGERWRCDLARALGEALRTAPAAGRDPRPLLVCDEFTSVIDRTAARSACAALERSLRGGRLPLRLVVAACHADVLPWLAPDWTAEPAAGRLTRGGWRRPPLVIGVERCSAEAWTEFAPHHYLSGALPGVAECFLASCEGRPAAFCATCGVWGHRGWKRIARLVVLPEFQGLGIGARLLDRVAEMHAGAGFRVRLTAAHPAIAEHCRRSPRWRLVYVRRVRPLRPTSRGAAACGRRAGTWEWEEETRNAEREAMNAAGETPSRVRARTATREGEDGLPQSTPRAQRRKGEH